MQRYDRSYLLALRQKVHHSKQLNCLPHNITKTLKDLGIKKKRRRGHRAKSDTGAQYARRSADMRNLTIIKTSVNHEIKQPSENMSFLIMNCQSVKNKEFEIRTHICDQNADLAILTETWLNDDDTVWLMSSELNTNGLTMININRKNRRGGGLALIHRDNVKVKTIKCGQTKSFEYGLWQVNMKNITAAVLGIYYRPPYSQENKVTIPMFNDEFCQFLADIQVKHKNIIVAGDFNIHINESTDTNAQAFMDLMETAGFEQHITSPTHKAGNILDHVYTERGGEVTVTKCDVKDFVSDHCIIKCVLNLPKENIIKKTISYRRYKQINLEAFSTDLQFAYDSKSNLEDIVNIFESKVKHAIDTHAPLRTKTCTIRHQNIWFTEDVREQKKKVQKCEKLWRRSREDQHWKLWRAEQKKYHQIIKQTKTQKLSEKVIECKGNVKELYKFFNSVTGTRKDNPMPERSDDKDLAEEFANHFLDKIIDIRTKLDHLPSYIPTQIETCEFNQFQTLTEQEVEKIIKSMGSKSCELDCMPTSILKAVLPNILPVITDIINTSLEKGTFVPSWKTAIIRPTLKKPSLDHIPSNYRPVSNLGFLSKVLEKSALNQFMKHCDDNKLMPDYQSAYRKNYSCETALIKVVDDILWSMERQEGVALMAVDLSAAFDTVDHQILSSVLQARFGITGSALQWFQTYLYPRSCKVTVDGKFSSEKDLPFSVPQGSCMGPVLYLAYASTLKEVVPQNISLYGYADDHAMKLSFDVKDPQAQLSAITELETCAVKIDDWMSQNRLKMNPSKTEFIIFTSRQHIQKCNSEQLNVCGVPVNRSTQIKYLGVILDYNLTFKNFITTKCKTAMYNIQRIRQIRPSLTQDACETLVLGLVVSHLDFSNVLLVGLPECDIRKIQRVQNIAAKLVLNSTANSCECLKRLHWLPISLRIKHKVLTIVFKCLRGDAPDYLKDLLQIDTNRRAGLRSASEGTKLLVPRTKRKTFAARAFSVMGPTWWNELPLHVKDSPNVDCFKRNLKTFLFDKF